MDIRAEVEKFLLTEVATGIDKKSLAPDEDLLMQGIIDSLGILKLVLFMEKSFGIKVNNEEMIPENFQTLNALAEFVEKKT